MRRRPVSSLLCLVSIGMLTCAAEHDLIIIGGGVAGYVAAIKAGQEGLKVHQALLKPTSLVRCN